MDLGDVAKNRFFEPIDRIDPIDQKKISGRLEVPVIRGETFFDQKVDFYMHLGRVRTGPTWQA